MACFLVGGAEAIVVSAVRHNVKERELKAGIINEAGEQVSATAQGVSLTRKLDWLANMLWGGAFLLLIEHIWHGEIVPWAPFLTAMNNPADVPAMLQEMATVGVGMAVAVTAVWAIACAVVDAKVKAAGTAELTA